MAKEKEPVPTHDDAFDDFRSPEDASFDKFVAALDRAYHRPLLMMWRSFLQGLMAALGATVGLAIVMALLVYAFRALGGIDYFAPGIRRLQQLIIPEQYREESAASAAPRSDIL